MSVVFKRLGTISFSLSFRRNKIYRKLKRVGHDCLIVTSFALIHSMDSLLQMTLFSVRNTWIQLHNIPVGGMTRVNGEQIGKMIGEVKDVDVDLEGAGSGPYLRVKVGIDITKPLMRGILLNFQGNKVWISFKYERLENFCFQCGLIKHDVNGCLKEPISRSTHSRDNTQYGVWLHAPSSKQVMSANQKEKGGKMCSGSKFTNQ